MGRNLGLNPGEPEYFVRISHLVGNLQSQVVNLIFPDTSARHFFLYLNSMLNNLKKTTSTLEPKQFDRFSNSQRHREAIKLPT